MLCEASVQAQLAFPPWGSEQLWCAVHWQLRSLRWPWIYYNVFIKPCQGTISIQLTARHSSDWCLEPLLQAALQYDKGTLLNCISFTKWWNVKLCSWHAGWHRSLSKYVILALQLDSNDMKGANAMQLEPLIILVTNRKSLKGSRRKSLILRWEFPELCLEKGTDKWQV